MPNDSTPSEWAVAQADAALKVGLSVPEIEQLLVAKGLSPTMASAVVMSVVEGRLRAVREPAERTAGRRTIHMLASVLIGCICLMLAFAFGGGLSVAKTLLWMVLPMGCIWYPEFMDGTVLPALIRAAAWFALLALTAYRVVLMML